MSVENQKIDKLIEESGIITHFKTSRTLRKNGWSVVVSPYYYDSISDSIRETDLVVEKQFYSADTLRHSSVQINIQLFIECKYIKQEIVFWFDTINKNEAVRNLEKEADLDILHGDKRSADIVPENFHHLKYDKVAKLFSTNSSKEDVMYKAMNQCLHSQINYRKTGKKPISNKFMNSQSVFSHIIQYPIIVCDNFSNLLEVKFDDENRTSTEKLENDFLLETNYREDYFLIDIVDINCLENFLKKIEEEAKLLVEAYAGKYY